MGTIVINQTDCKQNVVLQSSVDGITGGYYDEAGVWHEIGGGSSLPVIKVYAGKGISGGAIIDNPNRALTDIIPLNGIDDAVFFVPVGYYMTIKKSDIDGTLGDNIYAVNSEDIGVVMSGVYRNGLTPSISGSVIANFDNQYKAIVITDLPTHIRILYRNGSAGTTAVTAADFNGYAKIGGVWYAFEGVTE